MMENCMWWTLASILVVLDLVTLVSRCEVILDLEFVNHFDFFQTVLKLSLRKHTDKTPWFHGYILLANKISFWDCSRFLINYMRNTALSAVLKISAHLKLDPVEISGCAEISIM